MKYRTATAAAFFITTVATCSATPGYHPAQGETVTTRTADRPEIAMIENAEESGGRLEIRDDDQWILSDTSDGKTGNQGTTFKISYGPASCAVAQINAVLRQTVGSEPVDFLVQGSMQRLRTAGDKLVRVNLSARFEGPKRPDAVFPKGIELKGNALYESGDAFDIACATPRTRFRIWPSGGTNVVEGLTFNLGIRVDSQAKPETLSLSGFGVSRIDKRGVSDADAKGVVLCTEGMPPPAFIQAWRELGLRVRTGFNPAAGETVAGIYADNIEFDGKETAIIAHYVEAGTKLLISTGASGGIPDVELDRILPVNAWPFKRALKRGRCLVAGNHGGAAPQPIPFGSRFDMHLPGAAIESPLFRYRPEKYLRDPTRFTRISVAMTGQGDGCLPFLIDADVGRSRVLMLASSYEDATAYTSPGYDAWADYVAKLPFGAKLPDDALTVESPIAWARREAMQPFAIAIEEDESALDELSDTPMPREGVDGVTSYRYVYRTGTSPRITLRLRNHFNNIAPLAKARDLVWPENASADGLNDLAFTHASVRGKLPIHPVWCGRQSARQRIALDWKRPVTVCGMRLTGGGPYRFWNRSNPKDFAVFADGAELFSVTNAAFVNTPAIERAIFETSFAAPRPATTSLELSVMNLDPALNLEPRRDWPSNCSITEWEVWGWAGDSVAEDARDIRLVLETEDLSTGATTTRDLGANRLVPYSEKRINLALEPRNAFGPVRHRFTARDGARVLAEKTFNVIYIPAAGTKLAKKIGSDCAAVGLLCTPGWRAMDSFGLGMNDWTRGWGGVHDKLWAFTQDLLEMGTRNRDEPDRMLTSATRASHYTNPWRCFLNGAYTWDWVGEKLLERMQTGDWNRRGAKRLHVVGSDRWNGVPVGDCFGWDVFVDFDKWLRANGGHGLKARSRTSIVNEIKESYGDKWQVFNLDRYADKMLDTQRAFAERGYGFTFETHGSFPMAGGEIGRKLGQTHVGVGTDLFWELRRQDLWWTLGGRIAIVAANPDLRSGAYDEWGWVNSEQNEFWFGSNGDPTIAKRQWYAAYFLGRVTLDGEFRPYHEMGFGSQGNHGVRYNANDHFWRTRVHNLVTQLRPEKASGFGLVVSWRGQERRMAPRLGRQGFGLYPEDGEDDIESLCAQTYAPLVKQGIPITFVTSTHGLQHWRGTNPLILVDALNWEDWEIDAVQRLQQSGATVIAIGAVHPRLVNTNAVAFFARERHADDKGGGIVAWTNRTEKLDTISAELLSKRILQAVDNPISASRGLVVTPFVSQNTLFLSVCRQGDDKTPGSIAIKSGFFYPGAKGCSRVVSLDDGAALPLVKLASGAIKVEFPMEDASGRVLMFADSGADARE